MLPEYPQSTFDEQQLTCPHCGWSGTGAKAHLIDFYGVAENQEVHCPQCDKKIGLVVKDNRSDPPGESATDLSFQIG
jgi:DNA-directed RNA polymerase subunit RPC12/RpoP